MLGDACSDDLCQRRVVTRLFAIADFDLQAAHEIGPIGGVILAEALFDVAGRARHLRHPTADAAFIGNQDIAVAVEPPQRLRDVGKRRP